MRRNRVSVLFAVFAIAIQAPAFTATADSRPCHIASEKVALSALLDCAPAGGVASDSQTAILADIAQDATRERRAALARLIAAADAFGRAVAANEIDHGPSDACQVSAAEAAERRLFLRTLVNLVCGDASSAPSLTTTEADGALNDAYRNVMAVADPQNLAWGSVEKAGIRRTERAWLAYRDAFVAFAATLDQPDAAERVQIELTARRATSLESFLAD